MNANAFRSYLKTSLETKSRMNFGQVSGILARYDNAVLKHEPQKVFFDLMESFGNEDTTTAIQRALEEANKQTIDTNPVTRLRDNIARFKHNIGKLDIEISGVDKTRLAEHQIDGIRETREQRHKIANPVVPKLAFKDGCLVKPFFYSAMANYHSKTFPVDVEWTF